MEVVRGNASVGVHELHRGRLVQERYAYSEGESH
jgi:hypothetical protein